MMEVIGFCLITKNVPALAKFYSQILGVTAEGNDEHVALKTQGAGINIFSVEGMEKMAQNSTKGTGSGSVVLMIKVEDVDAEYEKLKSLGVEFVKLPETHPWGARSFWFKDPDGNIVDFVCVPDSK